MSKTDLSGELKNIFREYDQNGDGCIDIDELTRVLRALGGEFHKEDVARVFTLIDSNHDGKVQYKEFVDWVTDETVAFTDLVAPSLQTSGVTCDAKMQSALRKGLPKGVRAALNDEVVISDLNDLHLSFTGEESDFLDITSRLRLLDSKALRHAYEEADIDKNGFLQLEELRRLLFPSDEITPETSTSLAKVFHQMDKNKDGKVRCSEFVSYLLTTKKCMSSVPSEADKREIANAFALGDTDKSNRISLEEFEVLLGVISEDEKLMVRKAFDALDADADGTLSITEFSRIYGKELLQAAKVIEVTWTEEDDVEESEDDD
jgi:Ca2+-binding EF-hand superfamily protein